MAPVVVDKEKTEEQKRAVLEGYNEALRGDYVDMKVSLEEIRAAYGFLKCESPSAASGSIGQEVPGEFSEEMKREILHSYNQSLQGEVVDALAAIEDMRRRHNL